MLRLLLILTYYCEWEVSAWKTLVHNKMSIKNYNPIKKCPESVETIPQSGALIMTNYKQIDIKWLNPKRPEIKKIGKN